VVGRRGDEAEDVRHRWSWRRGGEERSLAHDRTLLLEQYEVDDGITAA
jgi:hypothetical protein